MDEGEREQRTTRTSDGSWEESGAERRGPVSPAPRDPTNLIWIIPLVIVVLVLVWYIFTQGEPRSPFERTSGPEAPVGAVETEPIEPPVIEVPEIIPEPPPVEGPPAAADPSVNQADPEPEQPEASPAGEDAPS